MENKTTWKENRPLACLVLVLAVLVGVLGIGTAKVRGVAGTALDYYNQNMAADFTARETAAQTILGIAGQELGEDDAKVQAAARRAGPKARRPPPGGKVYGGHQAGDGGGHCVQCTASGRAGPAEKRRPACVERVRQPHRHPLAFHGGI